MVARVRAMWNGAEIAAPAFPVSCTPGDNLAAHVAVTVAPRGSVLVVSVGEVRERGYWGEVLTTAAEARGILGLVIDGGVRDSRALEAHRFPVFATGLWLQGASKCEAGSAGRPVEVGGVEVETGDWIVGDADGVVVVAKGDLEAVLSASRQRAAKEATIFTDLKGGRTTVELLGLDPAPVETS